MGIHKHSGAGIRFRERLRLVTVAVTFLFVTGCCLLCPKAIEDWPAQQGVVVDADTGEPLAGAYVIGRWRGYVSSHSVCFHAEGTRTDSEGRFVLPAWRNTGPYNNTRYQQYYSQAYVPGYEDVGGRTDRLKMKRFTGTREERRQSLERVVSGASCTAGGASRKSLYPVYEAIYNEARELSVTDAQKQHLDWFRRVAASQAVARDGENNMSGSEFELLEDAFIKENLQ